MAGNGAGFKSGPKRGWYGFSSRQSRRCSTWRHEARLPSYLRLARANDFDLGSCPGEWCNNVEAIVISGGAGSIKLLPRQAIAACPVPLLTRKLPHFQSCPPS
jgi:hypothetical protein